MPIATPSVINTVLLPSKAATTFSVVLMKTRFSVPNVLIRLPRRNGVIYCDISHILRNISHIKIPFFNSLFGILSAAVGGVFGSKK